MPTVPERATIGLLGAGGQAAEAGEFAAPATVAFRAISATHLAASRDDLIDIATAEQHLLDTPVVAAVGAPALRRDLLVEWHGHTFATIVADGSWISLSAVIGVGCIVAPGAVVTARSTIGRHVVLNVGSSVSHDCVIEDFATISPGARISGGCHVGAGVFIGTGAVVSQGLSIADGVVIGAGAVVTKDIVQMGVYAGVPARLIRTSSEWIRVI